MRRNKKDLDWQELRDQLWSMIGDSTEETRDIVEVDVKGQCIEIYPAETNRANCFYHAEEVVDFCRYWGLLHWTDCYGGKIRTQYIEA